MATKASPLAVYEKYPEIYLPWSEMSEALMNGPSPFSQGERELLFSYAAAIAGSDFTYIAHSEVAYARGIENGLIEKLLANFESAPVEPRLRSILSLVAKLVTSRGNISQEDVDAVFAAGWDEQGFNHAVAITGRAMFMQIFAGAYGFKPMSREQAAHHAHRRIEKGYVNLVTGGGR